MTPHLGVNLSPTMIALLSSLAFVKSGQIVVILGDNLLATKSLGGTELITSKKLFLKKRVILWRQNYVTALQSL